MEEKVGVDMRDSIKYSLSIVGIIFAVGIIIFSSYSTQPHYDKIVPATQKPVNNEWLKNGTHDNIVYTVYNNWNNTGCNIIKRVYADGSDTNIENCSDKNIKNFNSNDELTEGTNARPSTELTEAVNCNSQFGPCSSSSTYTHNGIELNQTNKLLAMNYCIKYIEMAVGNVIGSSDYETYMNNCINSTLEKTK